jgi:hypothetical protein
MQACSKAGVLKRLREARVLLVDEISMLSPVLLEVRRYHRSLFAYYQFTLIAWADR